MEVEIIFKIAAVGIIVAVINQLLTRSGREEYTMATTLVGLLIVLMMTVPYIKEFFTYIRRLFDL